MPRRTLAVALLCTCWSQGTVLAQTSAPAAFEVPGTVTDWKDSPVADAVVSLLGGANTYEVKTDRQGGRRPQPAAEDAAECQIVGIRFRAH